MKRIFCMQVLLCLYVYGLAQPIPSRTTLNISQPLSIGQKLPFTRVNNVLNHPATTLNLEAYRGKTLIVHFLLTTCASCLQSAKKYDSLTAASGNSVQFLIVTKESSERVKKFMLKRPQAFGKTPVIAADTKLEQLFPYEWVSHVVWINPSGILAAITDAQYISSVNIALIQAGNIPSWPVKKDITSFNKKAALFRINSENIPFSSNPSSLGYSVLLNNMASIPVSVFEGMDTALQMQRMSYINHSIPELYMRVFRLEAFPKSHILIQAPEPTHYYYNNKLHYKAGWDEYNTYSYETVLPFAFMKEAIAAKMVSDLDFNLGTSGYLTDTIIQGYRLQRTGIAGLPLPTIRPEEEGWMAVRNLVYHMDDTYMGMPVVNGVEADAEKFLPLTMAMLQDINLVQEKLSVYGLQLIPASIPIRALVIRQENDFRFKHSPKLYAR